MATTNKSVRRAGAKKTLAKPPVVTFRGVKIETIVKALPGTFSLDLIELQAGDLTAVKRMLVSTLGENGYAKVREALSKGKASTDGGQSELIELVELIMDAFGTSLEK